MTVTVRIDSPAIDAKLASPAEIAWAGAQGAAQALKDAWIDRGMATPDREGWRHTGYWGDAAESVAAHPEGDKAVVTADKEGVRLHWQGGELHRTSSGRRFAIPLDPRAQGMNPREGRFAGPLFRIPSKKPDRDLLAMREAGGGLAIMYLLTPDTVHIPDDTVVPLDALAASAAEWARQAAAAPR